MARAQVSIEQQAEALLADARHHKRMAQHHRRKARARMRQLDAMRGTLARMGVALVIEGEAAEGGRHGRAKAAAHTRT